MIKLSESGTVDIASFGHITEREQLPSNTIGYTCDNTVEGGYRLRDNYACVMVASKVHILELVL